LPTESFRLIRLLKSRGQGSEHDACPRRCDVTRYLWV
jgi:hypothetical protein